MSPSHFLKAHFNIILPSIPGSSKWSPSSCFPIKILHATLLFPCVMYIPCISFSLIWSPTTFGEEYTSQSSSLCSRLHFPVTAYLIDSSEIFSWFYWPVVSANTHSLYSSLSWPLSLMRFLQWLYYWFICSLRPSVRTLPKFKELHAKLWGL